jgi:hypothetical protein
VARRRVHMDVALAAKTKNYERQERARYNENVRFNTTVEGWPLTPQPQVGRRCQAAVERVMAQPPCSTTCQRRNGGSATAARMPPGLEMPWKPRVPTLHPRHEISNEQSGTTGAATGTAAASRSRPAA